MEVNEEREKDGILTGTVIHSETVGSSHRLVNGSCSNENSNSKVCPN